MTYLVSAAQARADRAARRALVAAIDARNVALATTFVLPDDWPQQIRADLGLPRVVTLAEVGVAVRAIEARHRAERGLTK